jgi:hypothetical protein
MKTLKQAIKDNQRFFKYERLLRHIRQRIYDYEDQGKLEKAHRVIRKIKVICGPWWNKRAKRQEEKMLARLRWS